MPLPGLQNLLQQNKTHSLPSVGHRGATEGVQSTNALLGSHNPFLLNAFGNNQPRTGQSNNEIGVNQPLPRAMFLGYRDNKALYGGERLFVLA